MVRDIVAGVATPTKGKKVFRIDLVRAAIPSDSPLLKVALDVKLLEIVAAYLGMWPSLHSIQGWYNYPTNDPATSSQLWHHDPEDLKIIKVFIYFEPVDERNGPFTYIPGTHPFGANVAKTESGRKKERLPDEQLADVFPPDSWRVCTGPAGTMILADTLRYHRGGKPTKGFALDIPLALAGWQYLFGALRAPRTAKATLVGCQKLTEDPFCDAAPDTAP